MCGSSWLHLTAGRGPALGGVCLGKPTDSSQTRASVPIAARPSIRCVPVIARSLELVGLEGSVKERFETRIALALRMFRSAAHGDVDGTTNSEWTETETFRSYDAYNQLHTQVLDGVL